ncbi:MAG: hypothetical protein LBJ82_06335 [Deltaproteobacteria bacterium]|jgi:hypothetical protein|nr:hypothetical protein [Deltaproteobacteria bacterium]
MESGELAENKVDASLGQSALTVNNGETSRQGIVRDHYAGDQGKAKESASSKEKDSARKFKGLL